MFGHSYWGPGFYGPSYWGCGDTEAGSVDAPPPPYYSAGVVVSPYVASANVLPGLAIVYVQTLIADVLLEGH